MDTAQLKPFDLEKAKAGKRFCYVGYDIGFMCTLYEIISYLGTKPNGSIAFSIKRSNGDWDVSWAPAAALRMLPETKKEKFLLLTCPARFPDPWVWKDNRINRDCTKERGYKILKEFELEWEEEDE